jgi:hypothetical protein
MRNQNLLPPKVDKKVENLFELPNYKARILAHEEKLSL